MKLAPGHLPPLPSSAVLDRLPLPLPFSPDLLWRYPLGFPQLTGQQLPNSPLLDYKSQLPTSLATDPRIWSRDDVITFLRWAETEFDLQPFEMDVFQMNGKAMCLLTRTDLSERAPGSGDVLYNILQILITSSNTYARHCLPSSPVTPTSRHHPYPLSPHPHSHPNTPTWNLSTPTSAQVQEAFQLPPAHHAAQLAAHLMAVQSQSVTLSPAPSVESSGQSHTGSPQHAEGGNGTQVGGVGMFGISSMFGGGGSSGGSAGTSGGSAGGSNHSDSEDDYHEHKNGVINGSHGSPPNTPLATTTSYGNGGGLVPLHNVVVSGAGTVAFPPRSPKEAMSPAAFKNVKNEFFPSNGDQNEPNTNGRLLWDFLQQLLNDQSQRYTNYIAWKNRDTGVFKIVDPAGLAKLWGIQKNHLSMNYDKMSRALRYYYRVNILRKVQGERHCYQFLRNPTELKNIKNISLLRQQMSPTRTTAHLPPQQSNNAQPSTPCITISSTLTPANTVTVSSINLPHLPNITIKAEPIDHHHRTSPDIADDQPTDLSMDGPCDLSSSAANGRHVTIVCSPDQDSIAY